MNSIDPFGTDEEVSNLLSRMAHEHRECMKIIKQFFIDMVGPHLYLPDEINERNAAALIARLAQAGYVLEKPT